MKKLNKKFIIYLFFTIFIIGIIMAILQTFSIMKINKDFCQNYANEILDSNSNLIDSLSIGNPSAIETLLYVNFSDYEYSQKILNGYLVNNFFSDVYVFDGENNIIYLSNNKYGNTYESIISGLCDNHISSHYNKVIYSEKSNSFVRSKINYDEDGNVKYMFFFVNDVESFQKRLFSNYKIGQMIIVDKSGEIIYPVGCSMKIDFDFENCFLNESIDYDGVLEYRYLPALDKCLFFVIKKDELNSNTNIYNEFITIFATIVFAFVVFLALFYVLRREFK